MKKRWLLGGMTLAVVAAAGVVIGTGLVKLPGAALAQGGGGDKAADAGKGKGGKPDVTLEFVTQEVVQPSKAKLAAVVEFSGPLVAPQTAMVRARAGGTLLALNVGEGARVQAGQVLGRIELAELGSRVAERSAMLESARASASQAERTHADNERLAAQQFISASALETSRGALASARAQLGAAQASLDTTRIGLRDAMLIAPISGIVAKRHALPGEKVMPEQQVFTIVDLAKLELAGNVGTHEVARLAPGTAVQVQVEGMLQPVAGRIARIAPAAEPGTRSIGVTIELPNQKEALRAGQYAMAKAVLADDVERLTLPASAVGNTAGQDHVWLIENGVLARRAVTVGRRDEREGKVEVLNGVSSASQVLAARFDNLREGAKAAVVVQKSAPVASAAASTPTLR